jgi:diacylglycerol kinase family enzyme
MGRPVLRPGVNLAHSLAREQPQGRPARGMVHAPPCAVRVTIIQNPRSGEEALTGADIVRMAATAGYKATYASTDDPGAVAAALESPGDIVAIAGGDGTVRDVARRLIGKDVLITVVPTGTANNLGKCLGITGDAPDLIAGWSSGIEVSLDTGLVRGACGPRVMFEGAGFGPMAVTIAALSQVTDREARSEHPQDEIRRDLKVMREILADYPVHECVVSLDGRDLSGPYLAIEIMNISSVGPNVRLAPDADWSDGYFDVVLMRPDTRAVLRDYLTERIQDRLPTLELPVHRGRDLRIAWPGSRVHVDDEVWPSEEAAARGTGWPAGGLAELEVLMNPSPLRLLLPATAEAAGPSRQPLNARDR